MTTGTGLALLAELVSVPSHASQPDGIRAVGELLGTRLERLGFERDSPAEPVRAAPPWAEAVLSPEVGFDRLLDPLVWRRSGTTDGVLLLLGDMDAALAHPAEDCRLTVRSGRATGPAVADMKGGLVVMTEALAQATASARPLPSITVVLSSDEQAGSLRSAETIRREGGAASWCICMECGRDGGKLMRSRGHIGVGRLTASGLEAHAGSAREAGINAVSLLARGLAALDGDGVSGPNATVTPTIITGGIRRSVVPGSASAVLDLRARDRRHWDGLESRMRSALSAVDPHGWLRLELFNHRPGLASTKLTSWFVEVVGEVGQRLGSSIDTTDSLAAGSSAFVDSTRIPVLDGMGPAGGGLMTAAEFVEVESLDARADLLAATIAELGARGQR